MTPPASDDFLKLLRQILSDRSVPALPENDGENDRFTALCREWIAIREILRNFAAGNVDDDIRIRGAVAGCLKTLQANLRHLTWQVQQVARGDFSQRVDFMGAFSEAFNSMVAQLDRSLSELRESEARLLNTTLELQDEVRQRRRAENILKQSEQRLNLAVTSSRDGIWDINLETGETWYSDRFMEMFQYTPDDLPKDLRWDRMVHPEQVEERSFLGRLFTRRIPPEPFSLECRVRCHDGGYLWVRLRGMPTEDDADTAARMIGVVTDISTQKETERSLAFRAMHDKLTGLPNRYLLEDRLQQHVAQVQRSGDSFILVALDLDNFKNINDTWGHAAGDVLLVTLGKRISACLRNTDTVARLGGDEFVFIYTCSRGQERYATEQVLNRLYELFREPVDLGPTTYTICSSAGASFFPAHTDDVHKLFELADDALYQAKGKGKNVFVIWDPALSSKRSEA